MPMLRLILPLLVLLATLIVASPPAHAWGPKGHQIVGELAQRQLRPAARAQVERLLGGEPVASLAGVANWADEVRAAETGSTRSTSRWHYVSFKGGDCSYVPARDCPDGNCVIGAINRNFLVLADRARPDRERRDALKFLVHFIGDVHQPLHASPLDDRGGNEFQVNYHGLGRNLHGVWDSMILDKSRLSVHDYADLLSRQSPLPVDPSRRSDRPAVVWAVESCQLIKSENIYPGTHLIDDKYLDAHRGLVEHRLRRAGARLADMLNYALDPPSTTARP